MKKSAKLAAIVIAVLAIGVGSYYAYTQYYQANGTLNLYVQDAPTNVSAVYITFANVSVHGNQTGWANYTLGSKTVNILGLTTSNASLLKGISLSPQKYTMIRLYIQKVVVTIAGTNVTFNMSSNFAFINHPFTVKSGSNTTVHMAFNLNSDLNTHSKKFTPNIGSTFS